MTAIDRKCHTLPPAPRQHTDHTTRVLPAPRHLDPPGLLRRPRAARRRVDRVEVALLVAVAVLTVALAVCVHIGWFSRPDPVIGRVSAVHVTARQAHHAWDSYDDQVDSWTTPGTAYVTVDPGGGRDPWVEVMSETDALRYWGGRPVRLYTE